MVNGMVEVFNSSGQQYIRHADWLGSSRLATDPNGNAVYDRAYAPYGETYAETGAADRSFTGQHPGRDQGINGHLRLPLPPASAAQGRWLVPDPAGLAAVDITNPQTWNRYAYVGNNPLSNVDPLGLRDCLVLDGTGNVQHDCPEPSNDRDGAQPPPRSTGSGGAGTDEVIVVYRDGIGPAPGQGGGDPSLFKNGNCHKIPNGWACVRTAQITARLSSRSNSLRANYSG